MVGGRRGRRRRIHRRGSYQRRRQRPGKGLSLMRRSRGWGRRGSRARRGPTRGLGRGHPNLALLPRGKKRRREIDPNGAVFFQRSLEDNSQCPNLTLRNESLRSSLLTRRSGSRLGSRATRRSTSKSGFLMTPRLRRK